MGATEYNIPSTTWTQITSPGVPATLWVKSGSVLIRHGSDTGVANAHSLIRNKHNLIPLFPTSFDDTFYARCSAPSATATVLVDDSIGLIVPVDSNGGVPVNIQDQTTRPFDVRMHNTVTSGFDLGADVAQGDYSINLGAGHGAIVGNSLVLISGEILFNATILSVVGDDIGIDSPAPAPFTVADTSLFTANTDMSIDGSTTPVSYGVTNLFATPVDVTRIMIHVTSSSAMDDGLFGSLTSLTNGIVFRKKQTDGTYVFYWNAKNNGRLGLLAYDKMYDDKAPAGLYGMTVRLTYAGQSKHGVAIRLLKDETLDILVQDDLSGLDDFTVMVQGHMTEGT